MSQSGAQPWARIKSVLAGALERTAADRAAFLDTACGGDPVPRKEVESLLAAFTAADATEFIEKPAELRDPAGLEAILAGLDHTEIARVIDGGGTADGPLWLAMECVE